MIPYCECFVCRSLRLEFSTPEKLEQVLSGQHLPAPEEIRAFASAWRRDLRRISYLTAALFVSWGLFALLLVAVRLLGGAS